MDRIMIAKRLLKVARTLVGATYLNYNEKVMDKPGTRRNFSGRLEFGSGLNGEVKDATFKVSKRSGGTSYYVDWESGTWVKGTCSCGVWKNGTFMDGKFKGTWRGGRFCGDFLAGSFEGGVMDGGKVYDGVKLGDKIRWIKGYEMKKHPGGGSMYDPVYHRGVNPKYWGKSSMGNAMDDNGNLETLEKASSIIVDKEYVDFNGRINVGGLDGVASGNAHFHIRKDGSVIWFNGEWDGEMKGCEWHDGVFKGGSFEGGEFKGGSFDGGNFDFGTFAGGVFSGDYFNDGVFKGGSFESGLFNGGTFAGGTWNDDNLKDWKGGTWKSGKDMYGREHYKDDSPDKWNIVVMKKVSGEQKIGNLTFKCRNATFVYDESREKFIRWEDGDWLEGSFRGGEWLRGSFRDGVWEDGYFKDGAFRGGVFKDGFFDGGLFMGGTWEDGVWDDDNAKWYGGNDEDGEPHQQGDNPNNWQ